MIKTCLTSLLLACALMPLAHLLAETRSEPATFAIVGKTANSLEVRFDLPDYDLTTETHAGTEYQRITVPGAACLNEPGLPELPVLSTLIAIPDHGSAYVELVGSRSSVLRDVTPYPFQEEGLPAGSFARDEEYYRGGRQLPDQLLRQSEPQIMRDFRLIQVQVQPFVWDARTHELAVHEQLTLRVRFTDEPGPNELDGPRTISPGFDKVYSSLILNYADHRNGMFVHTPPRIVLLHGAFNDPLYLSLLDSFALWKRQKGAEVQVVSTAVAGTSNTEIKTYLQGLYDDPQTRPDYIILIGDVTGSFPVPGWNTSNGFGDYPYQLLAGTDQLGDVFIGRISAENTSQLNVIMAKVYAYERDINVDNAQWLNRMLLTADTLYDGLSVVNLSYYIRDISLAHNPDYTYTMLCQNSPNPTAMNAAINQGVGIFNYRGYAGMSGWSVSENNLVNVNRLCHAVILTCNTGNYDATGTTEQFIRVGTAAAPKGAVTAMGMWGSGTATMPNNALCGAIHDGIFTQGMRTMGEALLHSKLQFSRLYGISNPSMCASFTQWCNLMGDPTVEVYTGIPNVFSTDAPASLPAGTNSLELSVTDQEDFPVEGACATISMINGAGTTILGRGYTDGSGSVHLSFSANATDGSIVLTVSKHDFKALQQTIPVVTGTLLPGIPLIDDDAQGASSGNGNGIANAGETLEVLFFLRNTSPGLISGATGYLTCDSPYATVLDSLLAFTALMPGASIYCQAPALIQIAPGAPNQTLLRFTLHLTDTAQNVYTVVDHISITDAELSLYTWQIADGANSVLDPGETAPLNLTLSNIGSVGVENLTGELFTGNDLVAVIDSLGQFGAVDPGGQASTPSDNFSLQGRDALIPGMQIPFRLKLSNPAGFLQWLEFRLTVGVVTAQDPLGPDSHGYLIYDDGDLGYAECPVYNWIGIAPVEGGTGEALNISDPDAPGEGDDLSATSLDIVDLPFSFRFYGEDYQQITVCSNGFIVFGVTENSEFRNYRLPGPLGPSPMVAAFWDDLATGPGSGIYTWFDDSNHAFVIEWYQMQNGYINSYPETFQIILYDPAFHPTSFGDGPIKIQYQTFNNVDSGATNQNHGNFCSIGIESADQLDGLEYSFLNTYPQAASPLGNGRALYITDMPVYYDSAWLVPAETVINDQNNGIAEPGETIDLGVLIENLGNDPASGIGATVSSLDPYVSIANPDSDYHPIAGHSHGVNLDPFTFTVSPTCPAGHSVLFSMLISTPAISWTRSFRIGVKKPGIEFDSFCLNDLGGNNDGYADPGESFLLIMNVRNPSDVAALDLEGQLTTTNANVTIANPVLGLSALDSGTISQFVYHVTFGPATPLNSTIPFSFTLAAANAPTLNTQIALGCGEMGMSSNFENDNGGFTSQGGWAWGTPDQTQAHSGNKLWGTGLTGQYANGANYLLTSGPVSIGNGAALTFWHQLYCQSNFDGGNVSVSLNNGVSWIVIAPSSGGTYANSIYSMNEPGFTGTIGTWTLVTFDLSQFANNEILIRWHFTSDGSVTGFGWFLDDVMVSGFAVRTGVISGELSLSGGGDPSGARLTAPFLDALILTHPDPDGAYAVYLPYGAYSLTAEMPYHESAASPVFIITDSSLDYVHDFALNYLAPVSAFSLNHDTETGVVSLNWAPPETPVYPVLEYRLKRKTGPGPLETVAQLNETSYGETQTLTGSYSYVVCPVYAVGEGAPSDTLDLVIAPPVSDDGHSPGLVNALHPNYPNPFNPSTTIALDLAKSGTVRLRIYNLRGQMVRSLFQGDLAAGFHRLVWDGQDDRRRPVASGVYLYRLEAPGFTQTRKMLLVK
jgi:hypothetical protein